MAQFIFNTQNIEDIAKSALLAKIPETSKKLLENQYNNFLKYHQRHPGFTYHITYEDVANNTERLQGLYQFLGKIFDLEKYQAVLARR